MSEQWKRYSRLCFYKVISLVSLFVFSVLALVTVILWQSIQLLMILSLASLGALTLMRYFGMEASKLYTVVTPEEDLGPNWRMSEEEALKVLEEYKKEHETKKEIEGGN